MCWPEASFQHLLRSLERQGSMLATIVKVRTHLTELPVHTRKSLTCVWEPNPSNIVLIGTKSWSVSYSVLTAIIRMS